MEWTLSDTFFLIVVFVIVFVAVGLPILVFAVPDMVEVNLVNVNVDLVGEDQAWEFEVNDRKIPSGEEIRVYEDFVVKVIEFKSQEIVDKVNIRSLIKEDDFITAEYFGETPSQKEALNIYIKHLDGKINRVSLNIK